MVANSSKTYGALMLEASQITDRQEVGETLEAVLSRFQVIIEDAVQKNHENGVRGKYFIHIWVQKEPYAQNALRIYPQCRRSRPSPYQGNDHYLWSVQDGGEVKFEWCIPSKEVLNHILKNPSQFDPSYVRMLRNYARDAIETIDDYMMDGKVI